MSVLLAMQVAGAAVPAAVPVTMTLQVRETAGIRRSNYPATARVDLAQGVLAEPRHVRLELDGQAVPVQGTVLSRWQDRSVREIELDFNVSIAPLSRLTYAVCAAETPAPGTNETLAVEVTGDALQIGKVRLGNRSDELLKSAAFGRENIGAGRNAFSVTDADGAVYLLTAEVGAIVNAGPMRARVVYDGYVPLAGGPAAPFTITAEVPNSKSWVRLDAHVEDPQRRVREISFQTSVSLPSLPATWDLGTGSWSYGVFRDAGDVAELVQTVRANGKADWHIRAGRRGAESIVERAAGRRPGRAEGWGHVQDAERVIAFAVEDFATEAGVSRISLAANGETSFHVVPLRPQISHHLGVYLHYVANPTPIGAATPPVAMVSPLEITQLE
jgi:hypothetical protein